jgi:hypothetical protein
MQSAPIPADGIRFAPFPSFIPDNEGFGVLLLHENRESISAKKVMMPAVFFRKSIQEESFCRRGTVLCAVLCRTLVSLAFMLFIVIFCSNSYYRGFSENISHRLLGGCGVCSSKKHLMTAHIISLACCKEMQSGVRWYTRKGYLALRSTVRGVKLHITDRSEKDQNDAVHIRANPWIC